MLHTVNEVDAREMHENEKDNLHSCSSERHFVCKRCPGVGDGTEKRVEVLCDEVKTVKGLCYLGDRLNANGGCETAKKSRVRIGWIN